MTATRPPNTIGAETELARRIKAERELRNWGTGRLARELTSAGCPTAQSAVWRIEQGQRSTRVNELVACAHVFRTTVEDLLSPWTELRVCSTCKGEPPAGFTCNTCGVAA